MVVKDPMAELEPQFSSADATPTPWAEARGSWRRRRSIG